MRDIHQIIASPSPQHFVSTLTAPNGPSDEPIEAFSASFAPNDLSDGPIRAFTRHPFATRGPEQCLRNLGERGRRGGGGKASPPRMAKRGGWPRRKSFGGFSARPASSPARRVRGKRVYPAGVCPQGAGETGLPCGSLSAGCGRNGSILREFARRVRVKLAYTAGVCPQGKGKTAYPAGK